MKQEALANFPYESLRLIGLLIFLTVFTGLMIWVFRKGSKRTYEAISRIPLHDEPVTPRGDSRQKEVGV